MFNDSLPRLESNIIATLTSYRNEVQKELGNILSWWMQHTHDALNGGFIGRVDENNLPDHTARKGVVLNSRILWAFSSAYQLTQDPQHLHLASIAFNYLGKYFTDPEYGGVYWTVDAKGLPLDTKKQVYAQAFAIYGCSAYHSISNSVDAKRLAISLHEKIEAHSFDPVYGGYLEAFTRNWTPLADLRLSEKDANEKKTMNTHLHVLEAYSSLYRTWPDQKLKRSLESLIKNFSEHIIDPASGHLGLFFNEQWKKRSRVVSFGHDIEAAWLIMEAAESIESESLLEQSKTLAVRIASAASEGLDSDGGMWYEYDPAAEQLVTEKHWWVQAEAMIGFFNHWEVSGDQMYLKRSVKAWTYIKECIVDKDQGEWHWGRANKGELMTGQDKAGIWKCPYHNSRACIEIIKRISRIFQTIGHHPAMRQEP